MVFISLCAAVLVNSCNSCKLHRLHSFGAQISRFFMTKIHKNSTTGRCAVAFLTGQVVESIHGSTTATAAPSDGSSADRRAGGKWTAQGRWILWQEMVENVENFEWIFHRFFIWICLKIVYPYTQWLMIIIPTKWLFHWGYTPFSDIPIWVDIN